MSMRNFAVNTYGLYLDEEDIRTIYANYFEREIDEDTPVYDLIWELYEAGVIEHESNFTGEAVGLDDTGDPEWCDVLEYYSGDLLSYVQLAYQPSLLNRPYRDLDEVVAELRNAMDGLLPDDFDYRKQLCLIAGTYYG